MKLSEAIRLGSMLKPQGFIGTGSRWCAETCAYGAALDAVSSDFGVEVHWPWLATMPVTPCPACHESHEMYMIPHLNNEHRWTREQIADWVESIEHQQEAAVSDPVEIGAAP